MSTVMSVVKRAMRSDTAETLQREIAEIRGQVAGALQSAERLEAARLEAATFEEARDIAGKIEQARWTAQRAEGRLPELERRLAEVTAREQREAIARARTRWQAQYRKLRDAVEAAAAVQAEVMAADAELIRELGENVVRTNLPALVFRGLILPDLVKLWRDEMDRSVFGPPPADPAPRVRRTPPPARPTSSMQHGVAVAGGRELTAASGSMHAPRAADDTGPLAEGNVRAVILRSGYEAPDGVPSHTGRKIQLPRAVAVEAARSGAIEILKE